MTQKITLATPTKYPVTYRVSIDDEGQNLIIEYDKSIYTRHTTKIPAPYTLVTQTPRQALEELLNEATIAQERENDYEGWLNEYGDPRLIAAKNEDYYRTQQRTKDLLIEAFQSKNMQDIFDEVCIINKNIRDAQEEEKNQK